MALLREKLKKKVFKMFPKHNVNSQNKSNNNLLCDFKIIIPTNMELFWKNV